MGDLSLLEFPSKNVGNMTRMGFSEEVARKRKREERRKIMTLTMNLKNIHKGMVGISLV